MPHYEISKEEASRRLSHPRNRSRNLLHEERVAIGVEAHFATAKSVAEKWGIAVQTVSQIKGGFIQTSEQRETGSNGTLQEDIKSIVAAKRERILKRSTAKLMMAMRTITKEKVEEAGVRVAAGIARDMAIVADKVATLGESKNGAAAGIMFNIHPPVVMKESDFGPALTVPLERD